jgi:hypothetical protein
MPLPKRAQSAFAAQGSTQTFGALELGAAQPRSVLAAHTPEPQSLVSSHVRVQA